MAKGSANTPRISVNKLAEFIGARPGRQRQILRDQKYPGDFKGMYYKEATEAVATCLGSNLENTEVLDRAIRLLEQRTSDKIGTQRRISANIDALESFKLMLDDIDFRGASPSLGQNSAPQLTIRNVIVSIRPEILLSGREKSGAPLVGALKLHFPTTFPLDENTAGYVSALSQEWCKANRSTNGQTYVWSMLALARCTRASKQRPVDFRKSRPLVATLSICGQASLHHQRTRGR